MILANVQYTCAICVDSFFVLTFICLPKIMNIQVATNTLERVAPLTHAVGNVLKRVFVIGFSIIVFGISMNSDVS